MKNIATAIKGYFKKEVILFLFLGLSCGIPFNLIGYTLSIRMTEGGIDLKTIGLFAFALLPYSFKFLWAPVIDCIKLPLLSKIGPKKAWGLLFQILLFLSITLLSFASPTKDTTTLFFICFITAFFAASQDIVVDALRIDTLSSDDLKEGSSFYQLGYRIGMLITGAGVVALSTHISWSLCYQFSALIVILGIIFLLLVKEPKTKKIQKINFQQLIFTPFTDFIYRHKDWLRLLSFIILYKICNAMLGRMSASFYINIGFSKETIALVSGSLGPFITMLGVFLGGILMVKVGYFKSMMYLGFVEILTSCSFAYLAFIGPNTLAFICIIFFDNIVGGMGGAVFVAFLSSLCSKKYSATQYALLTSLTMVALSSLTAISGYMANFLGWSIFFISTGVVMLPALLILKSMMNERN